MANLFREVIPPEFFVSYNELCTVQDQEITFHLCDDSSMQHLMTIVFMPIGDEIVVTLSHHLTMQEHSIALGSYNPHEWKEQVEIAWITLVH